MKKSVNQEVLFLGKKLSANNFSVKTFFVLFFLHLFSFAALAQTGENDKSNVANGESAIDMSNYNLKIMGKTATPIMTSFGCPWHCSFCSEPILNNKFKSYSGGDTIQAEGHTVTAGSEQSRRAES